MDNLTGSSYPSKIFSDYMTKVHKDKIKKDFKMPNTVYRKDGDIFSKDIDDTLHETVLENILKEQIKKAENAVEDFEAQTGRVPIYLMISIRRYVQLLKK